MHNKPRQLHTFLNQTQNIYEVVATLLFFAPTTYIKA